MKSTSNYIISGNGRERLMMAIFFYVCYSLSIEYYDHCWALAFGLGECRGRIPKPKANMK